MAKEIEKWGSLEAFSKRELSLGDLVIVCGVPSFSLPFLLSGHFCLTHGEAARGAHTLHKWICWAVMAVALVTK